MMSFEVVAHFLESSNIFVQAGHDASIALPPLLYNHPQPSQTIDPAKPRACGAPGAQRRSFSPMIRFLQQDSPAIKVVFWAIIVVVAGFMVVTLIPGIF